MSSAVQHRVRRCLSEALDEARVRNPAYSLRAFARKLKVSHSALSEILAGKRDISPKKAAQLLERLGVDPERKQEVLHARSSSHVQLTLDHFRVVADGIHFAILSLLETEKAKSDPAWIARRLRTPVVSVRSALERLERLEMVERDSRGRLVLTGTYFHSPDGTGDASIRKSHAETLAQAQRSLEIDPVEARDFTSMTLAFEQSRLAEAREAIRQFRREFEARFATGPRDQVYKFSTQFIPLTETEEGEKA